MHPTVANSPPTRLVTVAVIADEVDTTQLRALLAVHVRGDASTWTVLDACENAPVAYCDLALVAGVVSVAQAATQWPKAAIVAVVPSEGTAGEVRAALFAGAHVCVLDDLDQIARYLVSVARRRGLINTEAGADNPNKEAR